jgi:RNA polymerase sigma-70 factor (ECF subfamily)
VKTARGNYHVAGRYVSPGAPPAGKRRTKKTVTEAADEELMQAVAGGDLEAFNELVLRYQGLAWKTAYRFLGDTMEAEDVVQESFFKILESTPRY